MSGGLKLPRKQEQALAALLTAPTIEAAARQCGVSDKTLRNWLSQEPFARAYRLARLQIVEKSIAVLQSSSLLAVATLVRNLNCGRPGAEIAAANHLLEKSLQAVEQFDLLGRIEALERAAQQPGGSHAYGNAQTNGEASRGSGR